MQLDELKLTVGLRKSDSSFMEELQRSIAVQVRDALGSQMQDAASRQEACLQEGLASQIRRQEAFTSLLQDSASTKLEETSPKLEDRQGTCIDDSAPPSSHELLHLRSCPSPNVPHLAFPSVMQVPTVRRGNSAE